MIFNIYAQTVSRIPCRHFVLCKVASKTRLSIFIHADILVLVSGFLVVVILSEWWLVPTTVGTSLAHVRVVYGMKTEIVALHYVILFFY